MTTLEFIQEYAEPLVPLLQDIDITEIMVNRGGREVYIERRGKKERTDIHFGDYRLDIAIGRMAKARRARIDAMHPNLNVRLEDGSRVAAMAAPCAVDGLTLTIRKFGVHYTLDQLIAMESLTVPMAHYLIDAVARFRNILISGSTNSGKTTLLNALANLIPSEDRIITIEDVAEMKIDQDTHHVIRFEARLDKPPLPDITIADLLRDALRHRPDRIILGEVRGGEAWTLLQSLNTGHQGSLCTIHANSAKLALKRLTDCVVMAKLDIPYTSIKTSIADAIQIIVQVALDRNTGQRRIVEVLEVVDYNKREFRTRQINPMTALPLDLTPRFK